MKIKKASLLLICAAAVSSAAGCSDTKTVQSSEISLLTTNMAPQDVVFDWQEAFEAKIKEFKGTSQYDKNKSMFDICDITGDGSPELIISPNDDISTVCDVYMLAGSTAAPLTSIGSFGEFDYLPELNAAGYSYEGDGFIIGEYKKQEDGIFNTAVTFYNNSGSASSGAAIRYEINNEDVTLGKYEETLSPYRDAKAIKVGRKFCMGDDAVNYAIRCSESWGAVMTVMQKELFKERLSSIAASGDTIDAAFEIVDLDSNGIPEVVVSTGILSSSEVKVLYIQNEALQELSVSCNTDGSVNYDVNAKIFYATDFYDKIQCWSLAGGDVNGFKPSDNSIRCGRKYELTEENINAAFL